MVADDSRIGEARRLIPPPNQAVAASFYPTDQRRRHHHRPRRAKRPHGPLGRPPRLRPPIRPRHPQQHSQEPPARPGSEEGIFRRMNKRRVLLKRPRPDLQRHRLALIEQLASKLKAAWQSDVLDRPVSKWVFIF